MSVLVWIAFIMVTFVLLCSAWFSPRSDRGVPGVPGLPLVGSSIALARHGLRFIYEARRQYGDCFQINLFGQGMVYMFDPEMIKYFFAAPDNEVTFKPAVEQFTQRVFGLPSKTFFPVHHKVLLDLRHMLVPSELEMLAMRLSKLTSSHFSQWRDLKDEVDLYPLVQSLVFATGTQLLFGEQFLHQDDLKEVLARFLEFEGCFELAASPVPHWLQRKFCSSRRSLLEHLGALHSGGYLEDTLVGQLARSSGLPHSLVPNLLLALLWASQANTMPATFWTLAFLLLPEHASHLERVRDEVVGRSTGGEDSSGLSLEEACVATVMDRRSHIHKCVSEAIRLRVQSIEVRVAAKDILLPTSQGTSSPPLLVAGGTLLALCPYVSHHEGKLYPEHTLDYDPDRSPLTLSTSHGRVAVAPGVAGLAFGGGTYRCPGRFLGEMEVALVSLMVLTFFKLEVKRVSGKRGGASWGPKPRTQAREQQECLYRGPLWRTGHLASCRYVGLLILGWFMSLALGVCQVIFGVDATNWGIGRWRVAQDGPGQRPLADQGGGDGPGHDQRDSDGSSRVGFTAMKYSGDSLRTLPVSDTHRFVGMKVPLEPCWVSVQSR